MLESEHTCHKNSNQWDEYIWCTCHDIVVLVKIGNRSNCYPISSHTVAELPSHPRLMISAIVAGTRNSELLADVYISISTVYATLLDSIKIAYVH